MLSWSTALNRQYDNASAVHKDNFGCLYTNPFHHPSPLNVHYSKSSSAFSFFFLTVLLTISITSLFILPWPILQVFIKKLPNSSSSLDVKYGFGPDFEPCFILPARLSFNVVLGTLYSLRLY